MKKRRIYGTLTDVNGKDQIPITNKRIGDALAAREIGFSRSMKEAADTIDQMVEGLKWLEDQVLACRCDHLAPARNKVLAVRTAQKTGGALLGPDGKEVH